MRRQNTIAFGSGIGPSTPRPGRQGSDAEGGGVSNRTEADWFAPTNPTLQPIGHELTERRGWRPPPPTKGLGFAVVSVLLVGVAAAGTLFFLGPEANPPRASTTTVTNADLPVGTTPAPETPPPPPMPTMTPADLPTAAPPGTAPAAVSPDVSQLTSANPLQKPTKPGVSQLTSAPPSQKPTKPGVSQLTPATPPAKRTAPVARPTATGPNDRSLPDLDRAAAAAGVTPQQDDPFATPGNEPSAPAAAPSSEATTPTPAPSDVLPDLQIKR
ncbi:MAG: hypothetical protein K0S65_2604 [Labilithrix sp.]|nr:hypothetical protein [Labilithrix sp.]